MKTKLIISAALACILAGCSNSLVPRYDGPYADDTQISTANLELHPCELDSIPWVPMSLCFQDSLLVVQEYFDKVSSNIFKVYHNNKMVSQFGTIGNGPEDFSMTIPAFENKVGKGCFYVLNNTELRKIAIDQTDFKPKMSSIPMPEDMFLLNSILMYNDSVIIGFKTGDYQLSRYDRKSNTTTGYNYFEEPGANFNVPDFSMTMQLYLSAKSSNDRYAVLAYMQLKMIDIIDMQDMSLHKRIFFRGYDSNKFQIDANGNIRFDNIDKDFFICVTALEDRFYALSYDREVEGSTEKHSTIYEMDYEGNLINKYEPDANIIFILVKDNEIYTIVFDKETKEKIICKGTLQ